MTIRLDARARLPYAPMSVRSKEVWSMGELDRDSRRRNDRALEEIRRLFERYRSIARDEARFEQPEPVETEAVQTDERLVPAGR
jgi:hypothetical protein